MDLESASIFLLKGLWVTVQLTIVSAALACLIAFIAGVGRTSPHALVRIPVAIYVEIFRGTSGYVQLFWLFFGLPLFGISIDPFICGCLALGLNVGSYGSEVVRGALVSVPRAQREAAVALNYTEWQEFWYVVFPSALPLMIAPSENLLIDLLKITPLVSLITVSDLTFNAMTIRQATGSTLIVFLVILVAYFVLSSLVVFAFRASISLLRGNHNAGQLNK